MMVSVTELLRIGCTNMTRPYDSDYNQIMYDTLRSYTDVLKYEGMTYDSLRRDLIQVKKIVDEWLNDVEQTIKYMEEE